MAKAQTFGDKLKKKKAEAKPVIKVIKGFKGNDGTVRFVEQFLKVDDINDVEKIDINR